jgi:hypothetical protein
MALRVPTLANCWGPVATGMWTAQISSPSASALSLGPVKNSSIGIRRAPPDAEATSTSAPTASNGGWQSPAGEADPRFPPTVPRLRIWGDPTVRAAMASPGRSSASSATIRV